MLFSSFLATVNHEHWVLFWFRKFSVDFRLFQVFVFCHRAYSKFRKPRKSKILCVQDTTLKVLLAVIKENLRLKFESSFLNYNKIFKPKWHVDNKFIAFQKFSSSGEAFTMGAFWFRKLSADFLGFRVFCFYHRARSKTRNLRKILFLVFFEVRLFPNKICKCFF